MKVLLFLTVLLSLMASPATARTIASQQLTSNDTTSKGFQFQPEISQKCQLEGIGAMRNRDERESALASLAFESALNGKLEQALDLSDRLEPGSKPLLIIVNMIEPLQSQRSLTQNLAILARVARNTKALTNSLEKATLLTRIAQVFIQLAQKDEALKLLPTLLSTIQSIRSTNEQEKQFAAVAVLYAEIGKFETAMKLAETLTDETKDDTLRGIAQALAIEGEFKPALQLVDRIQSRFYKISSLEQIALAYRQVAKKPEALTVLSQAAQFAEKLDAEQEGQERTDFLGDIAFQLAEIGQDEKAFQVIDKIDPDSRASRAADLADYYLKNQQYDRVNQVIQLMKAEGQHDWATHTLSNLAKQYIKLGQYDQAWAIANALENDSPRDDQGATFTNIPEGRSGKLGVLTYLASEYASKGKRAKAVLLFDSILKLAKSSASPLDVAGIALTYYQAMGDRAQAVTLLDHALNQAQEETTPAQGFILSRIAETYAAIGKGKKAIQVVNALPVNQGIPEYSRNEKMQALVNIADTLQRNGAFQEALQVLRSIQPEKLNPVTARFGIRQLGLANGKFNLLSEMTYRAINDKRYDLAVQAVEAMDEPSDRDRFTQSVRCSSRER